MDNNKLVVAIFEYRTKGGRVKSVASMALQCAIPYSTMLRITESGTSDIDCLKAICRLIGREINEFI
jgi:hypothetical protein